MDLCISIRMDVLHRHHMEQARVSGLGQVARRNEQLRFVVSIGSAFVTIIYCRNPLRNPHNCQCPIKANLQHITLYTCCTGFIKLVDSKESPSKTQMANTMLKLFKLWPSTVSELIHDYTTPHGMIMRACCLLGENSLFLFQIYPPKVIVHVPHISFSILL